MYRMCNIPFLVEVIKLDSNVRLIAREILESGYLEGQEL